MNRSGPDQSHFRVSRVLLALLLFSNLTGFTSAQQQQQQVSENAPPPRPGDEAFVQPVKQNVKSQDPKDVRAIATIAPEGLEYPAVRAPPARSATGLSSRLSARSLQDWEVEDIVLLATVDGTLHARDRRTGVARWSLHADSPMIETTYHQPNDSANDVESSQDGFIWVIEPSQDGRLFGYLPGTSFGLFKIPWTIKKLAGHGAPFQTESPPLVYTAEKKSHLYTVNARSGAVQKYFTAGTSAVYRQEKCQQINGLGGSSNDEECDASGSLTLGRTEYTIFIQNSETGDNVCTIKYSEWGPNHRDRDLYNRYSATKDNNYIYGIHDGGVFALDHSQAPKLESSLDARPLFRAKFESPVARVFDVMRPIQAQTPDTPLVLLPQPRSPYFNLDAAKNPQEQRLFVNCTENGSWYALSEKRYPVVTDRASPALCTQGDFAFQFQGRSDPLLKHAMVGVHDVSGEDVFPKLEDSDDRLSIEPSLGGEIEAGDIVPELPAPPRSTWKRITSILPTLFFTVLVCTLVGTLGAWYTGLFSTPKATVDPIDLFKETVVEAEPLLPNGHTELESKEPEPIEKAVRFEGVEDDKENQEPEVKTEVETEPAAASVDDATTTVTEETEKPKKKAHRGKRGGKKLAAKRNGEVPDIPELSELTENLNEPVVQSGKDIVITPDVVSTPITEDAPSNTQPGLQNLIMHPEKVLGHGSGGTFVFEGEFEGRDVAVKRMLPQYFELASQEVSLLEQSEEHPNVIRYYCRREDKNFLYIALERCQASLFDLFKEGRGEEIDTKYQALAQQIRNDPTKALRQLAEGLKYLHNFRLVHRDIKPQNMLIAYPKKNTLSTYPRLVISDFGLCKTLPDNASTLIGTTGNAGTAGWKAPELIFQPKDISGSQNSTSSLIATDSGTSTSGVKRAVDIFALGCVFFYVLSGGAHPFDDDEGWMQLRERNIKMNRANYHAISMFGAETIDLIQWMLAPRPEDRPTASQVLAHPFFWNSEDRLEFLSAASDRFDQEPRDGTSHTLAELESHAESIIPYPSTITLSSAATANATNTHHRSNSDRPLSSGGTSLAVPEPNFLALLDKKFVDTLGKQRKYTPNKLADLLRALRNKHHHWDDMPDDVKARVGEVPEGYLRYWEKRFPGLVVGVWTTVRDTGISEERRFNRWFGGRGG